MTYITQSSLAAGLITIGETAIAKEDDTALRGYYASAYVLHLPGADIDFSALRDYFSALRSAFENLAVRRALIIGEGRYLAARTIFSGTFSKVFVHPSVGELAPTGRYVEWEVMNIFRYGDDDRLEEEWVQTDSRIFLQKLGAG